MSVNTAGKNQGKNKALTDLFLWGLSILSMVCGSLALYRFHEQIGVFRLFLSFTGLALVSGVMSQTTQGARLLQFAREAWKEMEKVVWPKATEVQQVSIVVVLAIIVLTLMIWLVDSLLTMFVSALLG